MTSGTASLFVSSRLTGRDTPTNGSVSIPLTASAGQGIDLTYGTTAGKGDLWVDKTIVYTAGQDVTYDLYGGTDLTDLFGDAAPFRSLRAVWVFVSAGGDAAGVTVGNATSNAVSIFLGAVSHTATIYPSATGYVGSRPAGTAVTTTARNLRIVNNAAVSTTVRLILAGASA